MEPIVRQALGRGAVLGSLYDARSDRFVGGLLYHEVPESALHSVDTHFSEIRMDLADTAESHAELFSVDAELSVSCFFVKLSGSGSYMTDRKTSTKVSRASLLYRISTTHTFLNVNSRELRAHLIDLDGGGGKDKAPFPATHVVSGIRWGANVVVTFEGRASSEEEARRIAGSLAVQVQQLMVSIGGKGEVQTKKTDRDTSENITLTVRGDVLADSSLPTNTEEAVKFLRNIPKLVARANKGKGVPIEYELFPMGALIDTELHRSFARLQHSLAETTVARIRRIFENVEHATAHFRDVHTSVKRIAAAVVDAETELVEFGQFADDIGAETAKMQAIIGKQVAELRGAESEQGASLALAKINQTIADFEQGAYGPAKVLNFMKSKVSHARGDEQQSPLSAVAPQARGAQQSPTSTSAQALARRAPILVIDDMLNKYDALADLGVRFVSSATPVSTLVYGTTGIVYVHYTRALWGEKTAETAPAYDANMKAFLRLAREARVRGKGLDASGSAEDTACWLVDLDACGGHWPGRNSPWIERYENMELVESDVVTANPQGSTCIADRDGAGASDFSVSSRPVGNAVSLYVRARCPASLTATAKCPPTKHYWKCRVCSVLLKSSPATVSGGKIVNDGLFCACGWTRMSAFKFTCSHLDCPSGKFSGETYSLAAE
jgi:hypothetical protein